MDITQTSMSDPAAKSFFVLTLRGDRGPFDRAGVRELFRKGEAQSEDQIRDIFGHPLGTVSSMLASWERETSSDRMQKDRQQVRQSTGGSRQLVLLAVVAVVTLSLVTMWSLLRRPETSSAAATIVPVTPVTQAPPLQSPSATERAPVSVPTVPVATRPIQPPPSRAKTTTAPITGLSGWTCYDIGLPNMGSGPDIAAGIWTLRGVGKVIWNDRDICRVAATTLIGDGMVSTRLMSLSAKGKGFAGIMLRLSTETDSAKVFFGQDKDHGVRVGCRYTPGRRIESVVLANEAYPLWLRLVRREREISAGMSHDGRTWISVGKSMTVPSFTGPLLAGVVVSNEDVTDPAVATFADVAVGSVPSATSDR